MFSFFDILIDYIWMFFNYLINIVESVISLIVYYASAFGALLLAIGFMPPLIGGSALFVLAVGIIKLILGRDSQ